MAGQCGPTLIASVQRAFRLLEAVGAHGGGAPAKRLAREAGLPLGTTYHLLRTLTHEGYLRKLDDGVFVLGQRVGVLHGGSRRQALLGKIRPELDALRDELSAATYLTLYLDGEIKVLQIADGPRAPRVDLTAEFEDAGHATALGKCILRELDEEARNEYVTRHPPADLTPRTITRPETLFRSLDAPRPSPIVVDEEEYALGTVCFAVPVFSRGTVGSLGISLPASKLSWTDQVAGQLLSAAGRLTRGLSLTI
jgi:DNA-binding IclR family transcriptional regulator